MKVLSLFDGMSCGRIALERAGVPVDVYHAAEIDSAAIRVAGENWPGTKHLGSVTDVHAREGEYDLLIGGSPCQGFSFHGKQLSFEDPRSALFFEFARVLREVRPRYFLLENTKMAQGSQDVISKHLGVQPVKLKSARFSVQKRERLYWTNIPIPPVPEVDDPTVIADILDATPNAKLVKTFPDGHVWDYRKAALHVHGPQLSRMFGSGIAYTHNKAFTLIASGANTLYIDGLGTVRRFSPTEVERIAGVPVGYVSRIDPGRTYKLCGNGWEINTVAHIFKGLKP